MPTNEIMTITVNPINIMINNPLIVLCLFYFCLSAFFAYLFKRSNLFFKIFVFIFIMTVFALVQGVNRIEITLSSLLGVLVVYGETLLEFAFIVRGWFEFIIDTIKSLLNWIFDVLKLIFYWLAQLFILPFKLLWHFFSWIFGFRPLMRHTTKIKKKQTSEQERTRQQEKPDQRADREEELRRAKEEIKQARERAKRKETESNTDHDSRSLYEILGLQPNFTESELKQAYRFAVSRYHPDRYAHMSKSFQEEAGREFAKIQRAYKVLLESFN